MNPILPYIYGLVIIVNNNNNFCPASWPTLKKELIIVDDEEDIQGRIGFNQEEINAKKEFVAPKADKRSKVNPQKQQLMR